MLTLIKTNTFVTPSGKEVEVCIASPSQFILQHQSELLPGWQTPIELVLFLQESNISFKGSSQEIVAEKDRLRANFLRFGANLIFALQDRGYQSDLFDPRTGYPWLSQQGKMTLDDNAVVKALLYYPAINYNNCSLLNHPTWGDRIYPATIVTLASQNIVEPISKQLLIDRGLTLATFEV